MEDMDPVEELHEIRKKIVAEAGGSPAGLMRYLRSLEKREARKTAGRAAKTSTRKTGSQSKARAS